MFSKSVGDIVENIYEENRLEVAKKNGLDCFGEKAYFQTSI